jgi:hypothetical protein
MHIRGLVGIIILFLGAFLDWIVRRAGNNILRRAVDLGIGALAVGMLVGVASLLLGRAFTGRQYLQWLAWTLIAFASGVLFLAGCVEAFRCVVRGDQWPPSWGARSASLNRQKGSKTPDE